MFCSSTSNITRTNQIPLHTGVHVGQQFAHPLATVFQSIFLYALLISVKQLQLFMPNPSSMHLALFSWVTSSIVMHAFNMPEFLSQCVQKTLLLALAFLFFPSAMLVRLPWVPPKEKNAKEMFMNCKAPVLLA